MSPNRSPASAVVHGLVAGARQLAAGTRDVPPATRLRLPTGRWLVGHAAPLASADGVVVVGYVDHADGTMRIEAAGAGQFTRVVLHPVVTLATTTRADGRPVTPDDLAALHAKAHEHCFIARSVNFEVRHDPAPVRVAGAASVTVPPGAAEG